MSFVDCDNMIVVSHAFLVDSLCWVAYHDCAVLCISCSL